MDHQLDRQTRAGFTLIELMITVAIVAILASIALPSYRQHVIRGNRAAAKAEIMNISNLQQQFLMSNRVYADTATLTASGYALPSDVSNHYTWTVVTPDPAIGGAIPSFLITFTPTGSQASDGALTLNSQGTKTPTAKWEK